MNRSAVAGYSNACRIPRARGDEPAALVRELAVEQYSPRTRG